MVHPLVIDPERPFDLSEMRNRVLGENSHAVGVNELRNPMVDLGIDVIRPAAQNDAMPAGVTQIIQRLLTFSPYVLTALHKIIDQNHSQCQMGKDIYLSASIKYCSYNKDNQLENPQKMVVLPLKVIVHKGECYLVCKEQKMKHFSFLRVDRITYVYPDKARVSAIAYSKMLKNSASKTPFMDEGTKEVEILFDKKYLNNVLDWFGKEIKITTEKDGRYSTKVNVINEKIIRLTMM